jgi:ribonuclease J
MARQGHVVCALVVDDAGELLADPDVRCLGAPKGGNGRATPLDEMIADAVDDAIENMPAKARRTDAALEEAAGRVIRRIAGREWGKRPVVTVMITRLED